MGDLGKLLGGIAVLALFAAIAFSQINGQHICNDIKDSDAASPPTSCDISAFTLEYYNQSSMRDVAIKYNDIGYRNVYGGDIVLPIRDSDCSLVTEHDEVLKSITSSAISNSLYRIDSDVYRDACFCNAQAVGASGTCQVTNSINSIIENQLVETAAENDKATLNIIRAMAPAGYKVSSVEGGKVFLTAVNELKSDNPIGITYQVFDTYSCSLNDLGKRIYDYSMVGTRLTSEMKKGVFYHGSDQALINVNNDFKNLKDSDTVGMGWNQLTAAMVSGDKCPLNFADPKYTSDLDTVSSSIKSGQEAGKSSTDAYLSYILPIQHDADMARVDAKNYFQDYNTAPTVIAAVFRIHRLPEFIEAVLTYFDAKNKFERGLYFSSTRGFVSAVGQYSHWKQTSLIELVLDAIFWSLVLALFWIIILLKLGVLRFPNSYSG